MPHLALSVQEDVLVDHIILIIKVNVMHLEQIILLLYSEIHIIISRKKKQGLSPCTEKYPLLSA